MTLQEQCCTLEQGKRLVELGVKEGAHFSHFKAPSHAGICLTEIAIRHIAMLCGHFYDKEDVELTPAYNVAELGELLPLECDSGKDEAELGFGGLFQDSKEWCKGYSSRYKPLNGKEVLEFGLTEAQARAALLIHLIENNLITLKPEDNGSKIL